MKCKKYIAIALCLGITASSFNGFFISYAENGPTGTDSAETEYSQGLAGTQNIAELEAEVPDNATTPSADVLSASEDNDVILYEGSRNSSDKDNPFADDVFGIGGEELNALVEEGFTIQEILEADDISNEILVAPKELLEMKKETNKSLAELKEAILKERKDNSIRYLKNKYAKEFDKLKKDKLSEDEIISILVYADTNKVQVTDDLLKQYKKTGKELFRQSVKTGLSDEFKKKYSISDKDAAKLTDELIKMFEEIAKKTNKPVKEIITSYLKDLKK